MSVKYADIRHARRPSHSSPRWRKRTGILALLASSITGAGCTVVTPPHIPTLRSYPPQLIEAPVLVPPNPGVNRLGPNYFEAGRGDVRGFAQEQERDDYCWAACLQTILQYQGIPATQEQIVQHIHGEVPSGAFDGEFSANLHQILQGVNGLAVNRVGRAAYMNATVFASDPLGIVADMANNWPLILGLKQGSNGGGHVFVLVSVTYAYTPNGSVAFDRFTVFDPSPGKGEKVLSAEEVEKQIAFAIRMRVQHG